MPNRSRTTSGARPNEGSSSSISRGRSIRARATASICCSPPESVPACWVCRCFKTGKCAYMRSMSERMPALSLRVMAPSWRFSSTVMVVKVPRPCGTWAMPNRTMLSVERLFSGLPSNSTPPVERTMLQIARSVVVLPAPLAPSSVVSEPSLREKDRPWSAWT
ncbi:hypothetical protein ACQ3JU_0015 (plasmid) [Bradyrhizobium guangxiense]